MNTRDILAKLLILTIWVVDALAANTELISIDPENRGLSTFLAGMSGDSRFVLWNGSRREGDGRTVLGFITDRSTGNVTELNELSPSGAEPGIGVDINGDGSRALVIADSSVLPEIPAGTQQLALFERVEQRYTLVATASDGTPANDQASDGNITGNGRYVAFISAADNLVDNDLNGGRDVFIKDLETGLIRRVPINDDGILNDATVALEAISEDGRTIAFATDGFGPGDFFGEVYIADVETGNRTLVSKSSNGDPADLNSVTIEGIPFGSIFPGQMDMNGDGTRVVFTSAATNLIPGNQQFLPSQVYVHDLTTGETTLVSSLIDGSPTEGHNRDPRISKNGRFVAFAFASPSALSEELGEPAKGVDDNDIVVVDLQTGEKEWISRGFNDDRTFGRATSPEISNDGQIIAFESGSRNLAGNVGGGTVFVRDRQAPPRDLTAPVSLPIIAFHSGKYMFHNRAGSNVFQWEWEENQPTWLITDEGGVFRFEAELFAPRGFCLTGESGGGNINLQACESGNAQQEWRLDGDSTNGYLIMANSTGECVTVVDGSVDNGAGIVLSPCAGLAYQLWIIPQFDAGDSPGSPPPPEPPSQSPVDHFKCYRAKGYRPHARVTLEDQFGVQPEVRVRKPRLFCNPVAKTAIDTGELTKINNPAAHLTGYKIRGRAPAREITVSNQFGEGQTLRVKRPRLLLVPSENNDEPSALNLDHFKCYQASGRRANTFVALDDQFGVQPEVSVGEPGLYCNPVTKRVIATGEVTDISDPTAHLTCYHIHDRHSRGEVDVENQFGRQTVEVRRAELLCVPSEKVSVGLLGGSIHQID